MWKILKEKGKLATLIGLFLSAPVNIWALIRLFNDLFVSESQLWQIVIINTVGMVWFILPSKISIEGKGLKIEVVD